MNVEQQTMIKRVEGVIATDMEDMLVMLDVEHGYYYGLNDIGSRIWELLASPISVEELMAHLTAEYEVSQEQCIQDVSGFLKLLDEQQLLERR